MHEMSLMEDVLKILKDNAASQGFHKVTRIWLEIGKLSCVEPEALRFCFDIVMQQTLAQAATLEITEIDGQASCPVCKQNVNVLSLHDPCPDCGVFGLRVISGREMRVKQLEVE
jgi:hydrogenase nickel incorporation protein HypA/HybF